MYAVASGGGEEGGVAGCMYASAAGRAVSVEKGGQGQLDVGVAGGRAPRGGMTILPGDEGHIAGRVVPADRGRGGGDSQATQSMTSRAARTARQAVRVSNVGT